MSDQSEFEKTPVNQVRQAAKRGHYDRDTVHQVLDSNLVANVGFATPEGPFIIPMLFARRDDQLLFHGSTKSRLMRMLCGGSPICVSATSLDGLVLAKSVFHHSMNYRSVTVFGCGVEITDETQRMEALRIITDKVMQGRWEDARPPNQQEMKATCVVGISIDSASAKIRDGGPVEDAADLNLPVWSGVIPLSQVALPPIPAAESDNLPCPQYVTDWLNKQ